MTTKCKMEAVHIQTSTANQMEHLKNNCQIIFWTLVLSRFKSPREREQKRSIWNSERFARREAFQNLSDYKSRTTRRSLESSLMKCLGFSASVIRVSEWRRELKTALIWVAKKKSSFLKPVTFPNSNDDDTTKNFGHSKTWNPLTNFLLSWDSGNSIFVRNK